MKYIINTLGCKVNQYETQAMETLLRERGHEPAAEDAEADVVIVNSCAVTAESGRKSRQALRHLMERYPNAKSAVCGCWAQTDPDAAEALGAATVPVQAQANALMEVAAGTSDAAVIDVLMAAEMTGEGTSYADLVYSLNLNEAQDLPSEEYGVGFRQGSDLVDAFNTFLAEKVADGTVLEVATTYGLQDAVILE